MNLDIDPLEELSVVHNNNGKRESAHINTVNTSNTADIKSGFKWKDECFAQQNTFSHTYTHTQKKSK